MSGHIINNNNCVANNSSTWLQSMPMSGIPIELESTHT